MSFDPVAPYYRWLETGVFGNQLQRARVAFVRAVGRPHRVLIVGEGNGRFLAEFVREHPDAAIDCVEVSARMIALTRKRPGGKRVRFLQEDIRRLALPPAHYDLVVTHFFLDCFVEANLRELVAKLTLAAMPGASWLLADFQEPSRGWRRRHAQFWIRSMYLFFRLTTGIEAKMLVDPSSLLREAGFACVAQRLFRFGMIKSELWRRSA